MSNYQLKNLADMSAIGDPIPLPQEFVGRMAEDGPESLADLSWTAGRFEGDPWVGKGFFRVPDPPPPPPIRTCSVYEFMYERMTRAERMAIRASADPEVVDFADALNRIPRVELDGPLTVDGLQYIEQQGLIQPGRAAEILA